MLDRKKVRKIIGYTHKDEGLNAASWYSGALLYFEAATILYESRDKINAGFRVFAFNAALSIELIMKAIIVRKSGNLPPTHHKLRVLSEEADIVLGEDQKETLTMLTEILIWVGRYPTPKAAVQWDEYHDSIFEKHAVRTRSGNTHSLMAHPTRFPSWENYFVLWHECKAAYD